MLGLTKEDFKKLFNKNSIYYLVAAAILTVFVSVKFLGSEITFYNTKSAELSQIKQQTQILEKEIEIKNRNMQNELNMNALPKKVFNPEYRSGDFENDSVFIVRNLINKIKMTGCRLTAINFGEKVEGAADANQTTPPPAAPETTPAIPSPDAATSPVPAADASQSGPVNVLKLSTTIESSYESLKELLHSVYDDNYLIGISDISITTAQGNDNLLVSDVVFDIYIAK